MSIEIRSQRIAQAAFVRVEGRLTRNGRATSLGQRKKYLGFARSFPTLIHTSGLAQAVAFALAKGEEKKDVIDDLCATLHDSGCGWQLAQSQLPDGVVLDEKARLERDVMAYMRLTRQALQAASWIKRYAEALLTESLNAAANSTNDAPQGVAS